MTSTILTKTTHIVTLIVRTYRNDFGYIKKIQSRTVSHFKCLILNIPLFDKGNNLSELYIIKLLEKIYESS